MLLIFSFGGARNVNLRNFARSYLCFLILAIIPAACSGISEGALLPWAAALIKM